MSSPRNFINSSKLRIKMFGPTLDDSVLYGVDRLMDFFTEAPSKVPESRSELSSVDVLYESCESSTESSHAVSKCTVPKLSPKEMEYIRAAIAQSHRTNKHRFAKAEPDDRTALPEMVRSRWAIARINEYDDGTKTYEIMKPLDGKPQPALAKPDGTEVVFVMFKNGNTGSYRVGF